MKLKTKLALSLAAASFFSVANASILNEARETGTINAGNRQDSIPYSQTAENGAKGYSVDICNAIAEKLSTKLGKDNQSSISRSQFCKPHSIGC